MPKYCVSYDVMYDGAVIVEADNWKEACEKAGQFSCAYLMRDDKVDYGFVTLHDDDCDENEADEDEEVDVEI